MELRLWKANMRRRLSRARLGALVQSSSDAIVGLGRDGSIESWNPGAARLFGYTAEQAIGQTLTRLDAKLAYLTCGQVDAALAGETVHTEASYARSDGRRIDVAITIAPVRDGETIAGLSYQARDVSRQKAAERELARLADGARNGADAVISIDLEGRVRHWSQGAENLYGFTAAEATGRDFRRLTAVGGELPDNTGEVLRGKPAHQYEVQRRRKDGAIIDVLGTVIPWRVDGVLVGVTGIGMDITERKNAERELARLAEAAEFGTDSIISIDRAGIVRHWNRGAERLYGYTAAEAVGQGLRELTALGDESTEMTAVLAGESIHRIELRRRRKDGTVVDVLLSATPWRVDGTVVGVTGIATDITERKRFEDQLRVYAEQDALTGLLNRRRLDEELDRLVAEHERYGSPATLVLLDLDNFKQVNDTLGHKAGDELLAQVAATLNAFVRHNDVVARMGGDEFAVLLPHTGLDQASEITSRLRTAMTSLTAGECELPVTFSIGLAPIGDGLTAEDSMVAADIAMYQAKRQGPNRIAMSRQPTGPDAPAETVLLCEDEEAVRQLMTRILGYGGYRVLAARTPREALELARDHGDTIDLLVSDVKMLGIHGPELAIRLRAEIPELRALFVSGHSEELARRHYGLDEASAYLQKPFTVNAFERAVRHLLDQQHASNAA